MRFLFVLGELRPNDANAIIVRRLCIQIEKYGHVVTLLGTSDLRYCSNISLRSNEYCLPIVPLRYSTRLQEILNVESDRKLAKLAMHPLYLLESIYKKFIISSFQLYRMSRQYSLKVRELSNLYSFDAIVAFSAPFYAAYGTAKAIRKERFIYYQLDPYSSNVYVKNKKKAYVKEGRVCRVANRLIMTDLIYQDYHKTPLKAHLDKAIIAEFPCILPFSKRINESCDPYPKKITLLYAGTLYADIRSPQFMLYLFIKLLKVFSNIELRIVGRALGGSDSILHSFQERVGPGLCICGEMDRSRVDEEMENADFLINIGNTIYNQLPSKLMDYISTGKPIINLYKIDNCPSLPYIEKYPLGLSIQENRKVDDEIVNDLVKFIRSNTGKVIAPDIISDLYYDATPDCVASQLISMIVPE